MLLQLMASTLTEVHGNVVEAVGGDDYKFLHSCSYRLKKLLFRPCATTELVYLNNAIAAEHLATVVVPTPVFRGIAARALAFLTHKPLASDQDTRMRSDQSDRTSDPATKLAQSGGHIQLEELDNGDYSPQWLWYMPNYKNIELFNGLLSKDFWVKLGPGTLQKLAMKDEIRSKEITAIGSTEGVDEKFPVWGFFEEFPRSRIIHAGHINNQAMQSNKPATYIGTKKINVH
ncbi:hypothetical protein K438DRAFT_1788097 [Mycena galopus ATCC 62051]|nr:hypothetical protein K438DRAFT_1788097 [Mycena galopus ATCC 62051]